ncbi:MAG: hypothetical protein HC772_19925 [Leptolyngbyaceae cyanobacterium CRU_2_3]|nr:hypothetical protein [Leptolyngbyaceae cyanobacterium CRU_2_3]
MNEAQALIVESLLTQMLVNETYSVSQIEEAIGRFQQEGDRVSFPFEQVWSKNFARVIVQELRRQASIIQMAAGSVKVRSPSLIPQTARSPLNRRHSSL